MRCVTQTDARCTTDLLTEASFNLKTALDVLLRVAAQGHPGCPQAKLHPTLAPAFDQQQHFKGLLFLSSSIHPMHSSNRSSGWMRWVLVGPVRFQRVVLQRNTKALRNAVQRAQPQPLDRLYSSMVRSSHYPADTLAARKVVALATGRVHITEIKARKPKVHHTPLMVAGKFNRQRFPAACIKHTLQ